MTSFKKGCLICTSSHNGASFANETVNPLVMFSPLANSPRLWNKILNIFGWSTVLPSDMCLLLTFTLTDHPWAKRRKIALDAFCSSFALVHLDGEEPQDLPRQRTISSTYFYASLYQLESFF